MKLKSVRFVGQRLGSGRISRPVHQRWSGDSFGDVGLGLNRENIIKSKLGRRQLSVQETAGNWITDN